MLKLTKIIFLSFSIALISACGGGGGSTTPPVTLNAVVLSTLSNSQGISRITDTGMVGLIYSPQIANVTSSMNLAAQNGDDSSIANIDPANFPIISTTVTTVTRRGTLTTDGLTLNVTALKNNSTDNAAGIYLEVPGDADILMVLGDSASSIPTTGTQTHIGAFTQNSRSIIAPGEIGTFSLTVNYATRIFNINASTSSTSLSGNGVIDISTGLYASTNISFSINGTPYTASLYGNLNGAGASSTSGIFYTNDSNPDYAGSFIGSR
jgi:hypothetical protein